MNKGSRITVQYYYLWASEYRLFTKSSIVPFINSICQNRIKDK